MDNDNVANTWQEALIATYQELVTQAITHIPNLVGAVLLLVGGWFIATLARTAAKKILQGLDKIIARKLKRKGVAGNGQRSYAKLAGDILFWSILVFFIAASGNMLEWQTLSGMTKALMLHLPNVITGLLIIVFGFALSGVTRNAVASAIVSADIAHSEFLARIAQATVVLTAVVIGVEQLGINVGFVSSTLVVAAGVILSGASLAFAFGARYFVANIIGAQSTRRIYQIGQRIRYGDIQGYILEITPTTYIIDTPQGRATIPAHLLLRDVCEIIDDLDADTATDANKPNVS